LKPTEKSIYLLTNWIIPQMLIMIPHRDSLGPQNFMAFGLSVWFLIKLKLDVEYKALSKNRDTILP